MRTSRTLRPSRVGVFTRLAGIMNRAAAAVTMRLHVAAANLWRDNYNPLRGLTIQKAATLLEDGERGAYADLQWLYRSIEMQDATLGALIERRTSAIQRLDWNIKTRDDVPEGKQAIAERQAQALRETYDNLKNLSAALEFLVLASFRGFSHLEKIKDGSGRITELAPVDQWFWVREGIYGTWQLNRDGKPGARQGEDVPLDRFVIREVSRPVNRVALIAFVRKGLSQKDWDAFIETYGIPAVFVIMPPDVPSGKEDEYLETADAVVSDARGALPHGSDIKTVDNGARGNNPFKDHLAYQDEQIILRGTGGKLTMLAESGSGTLAGGAHSDTFDQIAAAEAAEISEILRRDVDAEILATVTPGEKAWAYFELAANEETDTAAIVKDVVSLKAAGYAIAPEWIAEKTGYEVEKTQDGKTQDTREEVRGAIEEWRAAEQIRNRGGETRNPKGEIRSEEEEEPSWMAALSEDLQPLGKALAEAMQAGDEAAMMAALRKISADMPEFLESEALEDALAEEFIAALAGDGDIRNGGTREGAIKGWETRRRNGWQSQPKGANQDVTALVDDALDNTSDNTDSIALFGDVGAEEARLLGLPPGFKRGMSRHSIRHIFKSHGDPKVEEPRGQIAVTREDIARIPEFIAKSNEAAHSGVSGNVQTIRYYLDDAENGTTTVVDEVRTGRKRLIPVQLMKFKKPGVRVPLKTEWKE